MSILFPGQTDAEIEETLWHLLELLHNKEMSITREEMIRNWSEHLDETISEMNEDDA